MDMKRNKSGMMAGILGMLCFLCISCALPLLMSRTYDEEKRALVAQLQEQDGESARRVLNLLLTTSRQEYSGKASEAEVQAMWREALFQNAYVESDWTEMEKARRWKYFGGWLIICAAFLCGGIFFALRYGKRLEREHLELYRLLERGIPIVRRGIEEDSLGGLASYEREWEDFIERQSKGGIGKTGERILELIRLQYRYGEREQDRKEQMQNFVENVAHQWKTPLARMLLSLDMMTGENWEQKRENCLEEIQGLHPLVERLLNVARMESGKVTFHSKPMELKTLLEDAGRKVKDWRRITWVWRTDREEYMIEGDEVWLEQAFFNLYENAEKQMERLENPSIVTEIRQKDKGVAIQIQDVGEGIDEEHIRDLFCRFYSGGQGEGASTGIGLHLAHEIIERHQGHVWAYNGERGAVFEVFLPQFALKRK